MPTEETVIKFTFPSAELFSKTMSEKTVKSEFGSFSLNQIKLAILLMFEKSIALSGKDMEEFMTDSFIEALEEVITKVKSGKGKSAFKLMREMLDE